MMHDQGAANPILQYFTPKMDGALGKVHSMTGLQLPLEQEQYANIVFVMGAMELLGGVLFTLNVKLGAVILVSGSGRVGPGRRGCPCATPAHPDRPACTHRPQAGSGSSFSTTTHCALRCVSPRCRWACCYPLRW